jgi:hypothetical protein
VPGAVRALHGAFGLDRDQVLAEDARGDHRPTVAGSG